LDPLGYFAVSADPEDELLASADSFAGAGVAALAAPAASAASATISKAAPAASRVLFLRRDRPIRDCTNYTPFLDRQGV